MKIIKHRERIEVVTYHRSFDYEDMPGAGYGFDCDEQGNVVDPQHPSYLKCISGSVERWEGVQYVYDNKTEDHPEDHQPVPGTGHKVTVRMVDLGVRKIEHSYIEPAIGECACGAHVELHGFTNTCERCERDYNSSGQLLAPREFWGEETGESLDEILAIK